MILQVQLDQNENFSNIGFAKAVIEGERLSLSDIREIAHHLLVYADHQEEVQK